MVIYGIPNCDTIKKTLDWFKANKIEYSFHDYKKLGISKEKLKSWIKQVGVDTIINKKSTTWKALTVEEQQTINTPSAAIALILKNPSIIKRPFIESGGDVLITGFNEKQYEQKIKNL